MGTFIFSEITTAILSFFGGLLSFFAGINIKKAFRFGFVRRFRLNRHLNKALKRDDKKGAEYFQILYLESKLYSNDEIKQGTSISTLLQLEPERTFEIFIDRMGSEPKLSQPIKRMLISEIKGLAKKI